MNIAHAHDFKNTLQAIGLAVTGWSFFAVLDVMAKHLMGGYAPAQIIALTALVSMALSGVILFHRAGLRGFYTKKWRWHAARAAVFSLSAYCAVNAIGRIPLADFYGIVFLTPMLVAVLSVFFLGEIVGRHRIVSIIVGFCGVLVLAQPGFQIGNIGYLFALGVAFTASANAILIRKIGREAQPLLFAFFPMLGNCIVFLPFLPGQFVMPQIPLDMTLFVFSGVVVVIANISLATGYVRAPAAAVIAPFHYVQMIWGIFFGYIFFHDVPTLPTMIGAGIIISAGLYLLWRERVHGKLQPSIPSPLV